MKGGNGCSSLKIRSSERLLVVMRLYTNGTMQVRDHSLKESATWGQTEVL